MSQIFWKLVGIVIMIIIMMKHNTCVIGWVGLQTLTCKHSNNFGLKAQKVKWNMNILLWNHWPFLNSSFFNQNLIIWFRYRHWWFFFLYIVKLLCPRHYRKALCHIFVILNIKSGQNVVWRDTHTFYMHISSWMIISRL